MSLERIRQSNQCARARDVLGFATAPFAVADFSVAHRQLKREPWSPHVLFKRTKLRFAPRRTQQAACPRRAQLVCSGTALKSQRCLVACSCTKKPFTNFFFYEMDEVHVRLCASQGFTQRLDSGRRSALTRARTARC